MGALIAPRKPTMMAALVIAVVWVAAWLFSIPFGATGLHGVVYGAVAGLGCAFTALDLRTRTLVGMLAVVLGAGGIAASGMPWLAASLVGVATVIQYWTNQIATAMAVTIPLVTAMSATPGNTGNPWVYALGLAVGFAALQVLTAVLKAQRPPNPTPQVSAFWHAALLTPASFLVVLVTSMFATPHGYWMIAALNGAVRTTPEASSRQRVDRLVGTLVGVVIAVAAVLIVPQPWAIVLALVLCLLMLGWAFTGSVRKRTMYITPMVVLMGSQELGTQGLEALAGLRLVLTLLGLALAVVVSLALDAILASRTKESEQ